MKEIDAQIDRIKKSNIVDKNQSIIEVYESALSSFQHDIESCALLELEFASFLIHEHLFSRIPDLLDDSLEKYQSLLSENPKNDSYINSIMKICVQCSYPGYRLYSTQQIEERLKMAKILYQEMTSPYEECYLANYAEILTALGRICWDTSRHGQSEDYFKESLGIGRKLVALYGDKYLDKVAQLLNNIGIVHNDVVEYDLSEKEFKESISIREKQRDILGEDVFMVRYGNNLAKAFCNLAIVQLDMKKYDEAEENYTKSLKLRRQLVKKDPKYRYDLSYSLLNIGIFHHNINMLEEAEKELKEALKIRKQLAKQNEEYWEGVAYILHNLGHLHKDTNHVVLAEKEYKAALKIRLEFFKKDPMRYLNKVARTIRYLANLYFEQERYEDAAREYSRALELLTRLAESTPDMYLEDLEVTLNSVMSFSDDTRRLAVNERNLMDNLKICEEKSITKSKLKRYVPKIHLLLARLYNYYFLYEKARIELSVAKRLYNDLLQEPESLIYDLDNVREEVKSLEKILFQINEEEERLRNRTKSVLKERSKNYYFLGEKIEKSVLYRYMSLNTAYICLKNNSLWFVEPETWVDKFEGLYYSADYSAVDLNNSVPKTYYACCMTVDKACQASWMVYAYNQTGKNSKCVQFVIDRKAFQKQLEQFASKYGMTVYEGVVDYSHSENTILGIRDSYNRWHNVFFKEFNLDKLLSLMLIKRDAYKFESEVRFFLVPQGDNSYPKIPNRKCVPLVLDWSKIIKKIYIDSNCSDEEKKEFKAFFYEYLAKSYKGRKVPNVDIVDFDVNSVPKSFNRHIDKCNLSLE